MHDDGKNPGLVNRYLDSGTPLMLLYHGELIHPAGSWSSMGISLKPVVLMCVK